VNSRAPLLSLTSKLLNKLIGERDWSAQEVCHILLGHPLQEGTRQVITLDCRPEKDQSEMLMVEEGGIQRGKSVLEKYKSRNVNIQALRDLTLLDFLRDYNHKSYKVRPRADPRVISYFPIYSSDPSTGDKYENYCRTKMMLHHPFTDVNDLADIVDGVPSFSAAYRRCKAEHDDHGHDALPDAREDDDEEKENQYEVASQQAADDAHQDWELLGVRLPNNETRTPTISGIGTSIACTIGPPMSIAMRRLRPITGMGLRDRSQLAGKGDPVCRTFLVISFPSRHSRGPGTRSLTTRTRVYSLFSPLFSL
jgi:hypothetical protein